MQSQDESDYIVNDQCRYKVKIPYFYRHQDHIIYQTSVCDTAFMKQHRFYFRFKTLKQLDKDVRKKTVKKDIQLPQFPKTRSVVFFWNKTNDHIPLIKERMRQLQYYLVKLLNNHRLAEYPQLKHIHTTAKSSAKRKTLSEMSPISVNQKNTIHNECPQLYQKDFTKINLI